VDADLTQAFVGFGGTDINIGNALSVVFRAGFTKTLEGLVSGAPAGTKARYFMNALATSFGKALRDSVNTAGNPDLDPVFADLTILGL
jgi:hypothetical protein